MSAGVATLDTVISHYAGCDSAEKIRGFIQHCYSFWTTFVLLGGDNTIVPYRYGWNGGHEYNPKNPSWDDEVIPTDLYYSDLTGDWDIDNDCRWGEPKNDTTGHPEEGDYWAEVFVGRVPCRTKQDVAVYLNKVLTYERNMGGLSRPTAHLATEEDDMQYYSQAESLATFFPSWFTQTIWRELPSEYDTLPYFPKGAAFVQEMNKGYGFVSILCHSGNAGHRIASPGNNGDTPSGWTLKGWQFTVFDSQNAEWNESGNGIDNLAYDAYPVVYSIGCHTSALDNPFRPDSFTVAEGFSVYFPHQGGVAYLGNSRAGSVMTNWELESLFLSALFDSSDGDNWGCHLGVAESYALGSYPYPRKPGWGLVFSNGLTGDPELPVWTRYPGPLNIYCPKYIPPRDTTEFEVFIWRIGPRRIVVPVAGVTVSIYKEGEFLFWKKTDTNGMVIFTIYPKQTGTMLVTASKPPYFLPSEETVGVQMERRPQ